MMIKQVEACGKASRLNTLYDVEETVTHNGVEVIKTMWEMQPCAMI
jgi:hypothetical protein